MSVRNKPLGRISVDIIDDLCQGSIDMHIHSGPDPDVERPLDGAQIVKLAESAGMSGIVLKSFSYPTVSEAYVVQKHIATNVSVFGSIVISYTTTGGLTYAAKTIETLGKLGCKVVWFPAMASKRSYQHFGNEGGIYILDENGKLKPEVYEILEVVKKYDMVLCSGHMFYSEIAALFDEAVNMGITKMVVTHPLADINRLSNEEILELADKGAYIEHVYGILMPRLGNMDPSDCVDCIKLVGAERTIMSTDLAQVWDPTPADGMRHFIAMMLQFGCSPEEVEFMVKKNPAKLLDLNLDGKEEVTK